MTLLTSLGIIIFGIICFIDFYVAFNSWQSRIKIGSIIEKKQYYRLVTERCLAWFNKTPTVPLTDNRRFILLDIIRGNYKRTTIQHWQKAGLILGLLEEDEKNIDAQALLENTHPDKIPKETDYVIYAYALLRASKEKEYKRYKPYFDGVYKMIIDLKENHQAVPYKSFTGSQMYVDTIGFICPFLVLYGKIYNNDTAIQLAINQINLFNKNGMYPETFLPAHTYNELTGQHAGLFGWGRGMGWYAIGLIDVWCLLDSSSEYYTVVTDWVNKYVDTILTYQKKDGSYGWHVLDNNSKSDSSTVVMLTWFLVNAAKLYSSEHPIHDAVRKSVNYLKNVTRRNGALDFCQGDTKGIGIYSQTFDILPFAQGYLLRILSIEKF